MHHFSLVFHFGCQPIILTTWHSLSVLFFLSINGGILKGTAIHYDYFTTKHRKLKEGKNKKNRSPTCRAATLAAIPPTFAEADQET